MNCSTVDRNKGQRANSITEWAFTEIGKETVFDAKKAQPWEVVKLKIYTYGLG